MKMSDTSSNQRERIINYFRSVKTGLTVKEGRDKLGIMHLPARVHELRHLGHIIDTYRITEIDADGREHRNGRYIYHGLNKTGGKRCNH